MKEDPYWHDFISITCDHRNPQSSFNISHSDQQIPSSRWQITANSKQENNNALTITELCKAARFEKVDEVRKFIKAEQAGMQIVQDEPDGYTPLHFAAMAIHPKPEIAELLIASNDGQNWLNAKTSENRGENTALHIAAANVNVTEEFIKKFRKCNSPSNFTKCISLSYNSQNDTPYHVAARSSNQNAIIYLLNTFEPTNYKWDVDKADKGHDVDEGDKRNKGNKAKDTAINICARNGNAEAVALLIKHGADISKGVLHEIVLESVRHPEKTTKLLGVYQKIVDNAVTWYIMEHKPEYEIVPLKGSDDYLELCRKTMIGLLTKPLNEYGNRNVIECALEHGACEMFGAIINTKSVFRSDGTETCERFLATNENYTENQQGASKTSSTNRYWTVFDVTNFTEETIPKQDRKNVGCEYSSERTSLTVDASEGTTKPNKFENKDDSEPYLTLFLLEFEQWKKHNILRTEPLKELTQPYIALVQRLCLIIGLLQLVFMICFTTFHMPTNCSLARMFNVSSTICNTSGSEDPMSKIKDQRSFIALLWLIWPIILFATMLFFAIIYIKQVSMAYKKQREKIFFTSKDLKSVRRKVFESILHVVLPTTFCIVVFVWLAMYLVSITYKYYVDLTGMVLLFGWMTSLYFLGDLSRKFSIFTIVVYNIVAKDMPYFMLFFGFTILSFSLAMHALRVSVCSPNEFMDETFFGVLSSAFGIGEYFEVAMADSACAVADMKYLFEIVYFFYITTTLIILLNVLIAMMSHRYEKAKPRAENIWRFNMLCIMTGLERHKTLAKVIKKCLMPNRPKIDCYCAKGNHSSLFWDKNRCYLRLMLPVDKQLKKP